MKEFTRIAGLLWIVLLAALAMPAAAGEHVVRIQHMELEALPENVKVGDVLTFSNEADMAHNLYVVYSDGTVDNLDTQIPGTKRSVTMRVPGMATVRCWIHPIIKRDLMIAPSGGETPAAP
ncbi:MAG TPA: methylamine utilization protein MauL [Hyphomicrobium sp.]|nr:methylamine utilization protein MauL [Hyphomicrobium sp.]